MKILVTGTAEFIGNHLAKKDFGYNSQTKLKDGIGEFIKWYKEFYGEEK